MKYCLDFGATKSDSVVSLAKCDDTLAQHVLVGKDATMRPASNSSLCVTASCVGNANLRSSLVLDDCSANRSVDQHWTFTPTDFADNWSEKMQLLIGVWALVADKA